MNMNIGQSEEAFIESLGKLLEHVATCDHEDDWQGYNSSDLFRGDHRCFNKATVRRPTVKCYCDEHKQDGDEDLPHALAYRKLKALAYRKLKPVKRAGA